MNSEKILRNIADKFHSAQDKYKVHHELKNTIAELSSDKYFLHDALKKCISNKHFFVNATNLFFYLLIEGDVIIAINLFPPNSNNLENVTHDNIHHHGWRLLSTSVISGNGYDTITFKKKSHQNKDGKKVNLLIEENYTHIKGAVKFIDSEQAHVVFHPKSTSSTLAVWSADRILKNQKIKKTFKRFPIINKFLSSTARSFGLSELFGLNSTKGNYFHPENKIIVETQNYSKPHDGTTDEVIPCMFKFFEQINFNEEIFFKNIKKIIPINSQYLCDKLLQKEIIEDRGISGDVKRRFFKNQILEAIQNNS